MSTDRWPAAPHYEDLFAKSDYKTGETLRIRPPLGFSALPGEGLVCPCETCTAYRAKQASVDKVQSLRTGSDADFVAWVRRFILAVEGEEETPEVDPRDARIATLERDLNGCLELVREYRAGFIRQDKTISGLREQTAQYLIESGEQNRTIAELREQLSGAKMVVEPATVSIVPGPGQHVTGNLSASPSPDESFQAWLQRVAERLGNGDGRPLVVGFGEPDTLIAPETPQPIPKAALPTQATAPSGRQPGLTVL